MLTASLKSNYYDIYPPYGTLKDVENLVVELKKREMHLVMDLVVNHTSDQVSFLHQSRPPKTPKLKQPQCPWFKESASSKTDPKRLWYIWRPPKYDAKGVRHPPNNWACILDEANSAWTWDPKTEEYFLTLFTPYQPDLNWECKAVREEVYNIMRFWIDKGAKGFRMDVINLISKDLSFQDAAETRPGKTYQAAMDHFANGPKLKEYLQEMKREVLSKHDLLTVGEMPFLSDPDRIIDLVSAEEGALNMIFTFDLMSLDEVPGESKFSHKQ
ncbi:hypothetical protein IMZ48_33465 [Candidatus Bathyarchaeota archaeon]|nr:hypothetical protein [Candidatus Bathyarchaeota archaeon]